MTLDITVTGESVLADAALYERSSSQLGMVLCQELRPGTVLLLGIMIYVGRAWRIILSAWLLALERWVVKCQDSLSIHAERMICFT